MTRNALTLASGVQDGRLPSHDTLLICGLIVAMAVAFAAIVVYVRRRRRPKPVRDQWGVMAVMGELCPHGWQAEITLYGSGAPVPADAPASRVPMVELEWKQFDEEPGRIVAARRVWAPTIGQALQSMVDDRWTDLALEQIEQATIEDDPWWSE